MVKYFDIAQGTSFPFYYWLDFLHFGQFDSKAYSIDVNRPPGYKFGHESDNISGGPVGGCLAMFLNICVTHKSDMIHDIKSGPLGLLRIRSRSGPGLTESIRGSLGSARVPVFRLTK